MPRPRTRTATYQLLASALLLTSLTALLLSACSGGSTSGHTTTTAPAPAPPRDGSLAAFDGGSTDELAYIATNGDVHLVSSPRGATTMWSDEDVTMAARAPAARGIVVKGLVDPNATTISLYAIDDTTGDVMELSGPVPGTTAASTGGGWQKSDITRSAGVVPPASTTATSGALTALVSALATVGGETRVILPGCPCKLVAYFDANGKLVELGAAVGSTHWVASPSYPGSPASPQSALTATAIVATGDVMYTFVDAGGNLRFGLHSVMPLDPQQPSPPSFTWTDSGSFIQFPGCPCRATPLAADWWQTEGSYHVFSLDQASGQIWESREVPYKNLPADNISTQVPSAGLPSGMALSAYASDAASDRSLHIQWIDPSGHVQDATYAYQGNGLTLTDLTAQAGAPVAKATVLAGYTAAADGSQHVGYLTAGGHVESLSKLPGANWTATDVTRGSIAISPLTAPYWEQRAPMANYRA